MGGPLAVDPAAVAEASAAWNWVPGDARVVETEEYLLVRFPDWFHSPLELLRLTPQRETAVVLDEVLEHSAGLDADRLSVWVKLDAPADLDAVLDERGAEVEETLDVLAAPLTPATDLDALRAGAQGLQTRWVDDLVTMRDFETLSAEVFGGSVPDDARLERSLHEMREEADAGTGRLVAYDDGRAASIGGLSVAGPAARMWGGATAPDLRGRGGYRAVLAERMRVGREHGCTMALVKGRVDTSAPILRRAGFEVHGRERLRTLPLR